MQSFYEHQEHFPFFCSGRRLRRPWKARDATVYQTAGEDAGRYIQNENVLKEPWGASVSRRCDFWKTRFFSSLYICFALLTNLPARSAFAQNIATQPTSAETLPALVVHPSQPREHAQRLEDLHLVLQANAETEKEKSPHGRISAPEERQAEEEKIRRRMESVMREKEFDRQIHRKKQAILIFTLCVLGGFFLIAAIIALFVCRKFRKRA